MFFLRKQNSGHGVVVLHQDLSGILRMLIQEMVNLLTKLFLHMPVSFLAWMVGTSALELIVEQL